MPFSTVTFTRRTLSAAGEAQLCVRQLAVQIENFANHTLYGALLNLRVILFARKL